MKKFLVIKFLVVFFILFAFNQSISAQQAAFSRGDMVINAGVGLGTYINDSGYSMIIPPLTGSFEYGVVDFSRKGGIGVGGYFSYLLRKNNSENSFNVGDFVIGPRVLFHYQFIKYLDTYAGLMLGYDVVSFSRTDNNYPLSASQFYYTLFVGARYYFTNNIAVFGELGYGVSPLQLGFTYKF